MHKIQNKDCTILIIYNPSKSIIYFKYPKSIKNGDKTRFKF
jgi:hypothetical protein